MGQLCTKVNGVGSPDASSNKKQQERSKEHDDDEISGNSSRKGNDLDDSNNADELSDDESQDGTEKSSTTKQRSSRKQRESSLIRVDDNGDDDNGDDNSSKPPSSQRIEEDGYKINGTGKKIEGVGLTSGMSHKQYSPGDVFTATIAKAIRNQDPGLKVEQINGKFYVTEVRGLFATTPAIPGDKILTLNAKDYRIFKTAKDMRKELKYSEGISILFLRRDPDASQSSESSYDSDSDDENDGNGVESTVLYREAGDESLELY